MDLQRRVYITRYVQAKKSGEEIAFYSQSEFRQWKNSTEDSDKWTIKYYKGLGKKLCLSGVDLA